MEIKISKCNQLQKAQWDNFIENDSINGTFLQMWKFLDYHAENRFVDCSLMFWCEDILIAVCPACVVYEDGKKIFYSHSGSTYGGIIVGKEMLRVDKMKTLMDIFEDYLRAEGFHKCILKPTMNLLCQYSNELMQFMFYFYGYKEYKELNIYIDYTSYASDVISNFSKMKKRNTKKCIKEGFEIKQLLTKDEVAGFHGILLDNLMKYNKHPIHSVEELLDIKQRLGGQVEFYGAYLEDVMMAGTMVFLFDKVRCAHTQYLAADSQYKHLNPMTYIYYSMISQFKERNYKYLSWGIATEHLGNNINFNLANNKEEFGSMHTVNAIYEKNLCEKNGE